MIFTIFHYLPTFGLNGFFLNARMAYIDPITNELLPSSPLDDASDNALMEPIPEVKQQDGEPSAMPSDAMQRLAVPRSAWQCQAMRSNAEQCTSTML